MKYRIKKRVSFYERNVENPTDSFYIIEYKSWFNWHWLDTVLGSNVQTFRTAADAKAALSKHCAIVAELKSDGQIMENINS